MSHPSAQTLAAYWLGDLGEADAFALEDHVFVCDDCTTASARMAALPRALALAVRPVVDAQLAARLLALDPRARCVQVGVGGRAVLDFSGGAEAQLVAFEADLRGVTRVDLTMTSRAGAPLMEAPDVTFDAEAGTVIIACRAHYLNSGLPLEVTLRVDVTADGQTRSLGTFDIDHIAPL